MSAGPRRTARQPAVARAPSEALVQQTVDLLGGALVSKKKLHSSLDVHQMIRKRISGRALKFVVNTTTVLKQEEVLKAAGVTLRTVQRYRAAPKRALSQNQSGRVWKFAEVLAGAIDVFGTRDEAETWLATPAMALNQQRPIDLLTSPAGIDVVQQVLGRLKHGVYT